MWKAYSNKKCNAKRNLLTYNIEHNRYPLIIPFHAFDIEYCSLFWVICCSQNSPNTDLESYGDFVENY